MFDQMNDVIYKIYLVLGKARRDDETKYSTLCFVYFNLRCSGKELMH